MKGLPGGWRQYIKGHPCYDPVKVGRYEMHSVMVVDMIVYAQKMHPTRCYPLKVGQHSQVDSSLWRTSLPPCLLSSSSVT
jgi:hypothetical protein